MISNQAIRCIKEPKMADELTHLFSSKLSLHAPRDYDDRKVKLIQQALRKYLTLKGFYKTIKSVKNPVLVGEIQSKKEGDKSKGFWRMNIVLDKERATNDRGRIYLITSDGVIKKIGKSECVGGIKTTMGFYQGGMGGCPSIRTFGIHLLIHSELLAGRCVQVYMIESEEVEFTIKTLFGEKTIKVSPAIHKMEELCRQDYLSKNGKHPDWNFQESGEQWPADIFNKHLNLLDVSKKSRK
jgi:hypothetical protein